MDAQRAEGAYSERAVTNIAAPAKCRGGAKQRILLYRYKNHKSLKRFLSNYKTTDVTIFHAKA